MRTRAMLLAIILAAVGMPVAAQQQVNISATIPVASPTGAGTRNLLYGVITPTATSQNINVPAAIAPISASVQSGEFRYNVQGVRTLTFRVTMPTQLTQSGATPLTVNSNGTQYGGYCVTTAATCTLTNFNPTSTSNIQICSLMILTFCLPLTPYGAGNVLRVYVGGQLTVPPTARAGVYVGTVTLTIVQVT